MIHNLSTVAGVVAISVVVAWAMAAKSDSDKQPKEPTSRESPGSNDEAHLVPMIRPVSRTPASRTPGIRTTSPAAVIATRPGRFRARRERGRRG